MSSVSYIAGEGGKLRDQSSPVRAKLLSVMSARWIQLQQESLGTFKRTSTLALAYAVHVHICYLKSLENFSLSICTVVQVNTRDWSYPLLDLVNPTHC